MIKIGIQKSGRLNQNSIDLLKNCGISIENFNDQLKVSASNFPLDIYLLRNGDLPKYIKDGVIDLAIVGQNIIEEKGDEIDVIENLGFSKCRVSIAVPKTTKINSIQKLNGLKIATSYPKTLQKFLKKNDVNSDIHIINGSVEIAPNIGLSDAICDIVSSGSTLFKNNLIEVFKILDSEAVLVQSSNMTPKKLDIVDKLMFRIRSVLRAKKSKYILLNVPNNKIEKISKILPVLKSPTVLPLGIKGWSSMHSVIDDDKFWEVIDKLKAEGAEDILVCPIEKMVL
mgnify:FL=1